MEQLELFRRLTWDEIQALIKQGYDDEEALKHPAGPPCGCQG